MIYMLILKIMQILSLTLRAKLLGKWDQDRKQIGPTLKRKLFLRLPVDRDWSERAGPSRLRPIPLE